MLHALDPAFLAQCRCYFGGGTLVTLLLDEYRESRDIDFLCSDRAGFRVLRETVTENSLGRILTTGIPLAREVRADRDGIRTFLAPGDARIKFEIILEARIDLNGEPVPGLGVQALTLDCQVAEKLLANTDRGLDDSTHSRDVIDLAFLAARHGAERLRAGLQLAETAYGVAVQRALRAVLEHLGSERRRVSDHMAALGIEDRSTLRDGLAALRHLLA